MTGSIRTALLLVGTEHPPKKWQVQAALDELSNIDGARGLVHRWLQGATLAPAERDYLARWCGLEDGDASAQD